MTDLRATAEARTSLHQGKASQRQLSEEYELIGLAGEDALAEFCGGEVDITPRPNGDGGTDCHIALFFTVDVKTSRRGIDLLVEAGKVRADIYVAAKYENGRARLLGWEWGKVVAQVPPYDVCGRGVISHCIPLSKLRPMSELKVRLTRRVQP